MRSCAVEGCEGVVTSRGWCATHYKRWQRSGSVADPTRGPTTCTVDGCDADVDARGLCHGHYQRQHRTGAVQPDIPLGRRRQPEICIVEGCGRPTNAKGECRTHRWRRVAYGEVEPEHLAPLVTASRRAMADEPECVVTGCKDAAVARNRCPPCYKAALRRGAVQPDQSVRVVTGEGWLNHGYWVVPVPEDERHLSRGETRIGEHRLVMARSLGRPLEPHESVHHLNGDRLDNRLANLELWSSSQPSGQRVEDKIEWAVALLRRYRPHLLKQKQ